MRKDSKCLAIEIEEGCFCFLACIREEEGCLIVVVVAVVVVVVVVVVIPSCFCPLPSLWYTAYMLFNLPHSIKKESRV